MEKDAFKKEIKIILIILITWFCISFYNFSRNGKYSREGSYVMNTRTGQLFAIDDETGKIISFQKFLDN